MGLPKISHARLTEIIKEELGSGLQNNDEPINEGSSWEPIKVVATRQLKELTGSKKRAVYIKVVPNGKTIETPSYWDGGSRDYWTIHQLGDSKTLSSNHPAFEKGAASSVTMDLGIVLVRNSIFMGKPSIPAVYATLPTLLKNLAEWGLGGDVANQLRQGATPEELVQLDVDLEKVQETNKGEQKMKENKKPKVISPMLKEELTGMIKEELHKYFESCGGLKNERGSIIEGDLDGKTDMTGKRCSKCGKGKYKETSYHDDMDGVLHCTKCGQEVPRWQGGDKVDEGLDEETQSGSTQKRADDNWWLKDKSGNLDKHSDKVPPYAKKFSGAKPGVRKFAKQQVNKKERQAAKKETNGE